MTMRKGLALVAIASAATAQVLAFTDMQGDLRTGAVMWFLFTCPGMAIVLTLNLSDRILAVVLSIGISLALAVSLATVMVLVGTWLPLLELTVLVVVTVIFSAWVLRREGPGKPG